MASGVLNNGFGEFGGLAPSVCRDSPMDTGSSIKLPKAQTPICFKIMYPRKPVESEKASMVSIAPFSNAFSFPGATVCSAMATQRCGEAKRTNFVAAGRIQDR